MLDYRASKLTHLVALCTLKKVYFWSKPLRTCRLFLYQTFSSSGTFQWNVNPFSAFRYTLVQGFPFETNAIQKLLNLFYPFLFWFYNIWCHSKVQKGYANFPAFSTINRNSEKWNVLYCKSLRSYVWRKQLIVSNLHRWH